MNLAAAFAAENAARNARWIFRIHRDQRGKRHFLSLSLSLSSPSPFPHFFYNNMFVLKSLHITILKTEIFFNLSGLFS